MPEKQLRLTETNSATDSEGTVWGIDASLFGIVLLGAFASLALGLGLWRQTTLSVLGTVGLAAAPLGLSVAYVLFKQSHPPGYDLDLLEFWLSGSSLGPAFAESETGDAEFGALEDVLSDDCERTGESPRLDSAIEPSQPAYV